MEPVTSSGRAPDAAELPQTSGAGRPRRRMSPNRWIGLVVGGALLLGGIGAVLFVDWNSPPPPPDPVVRPVKAESARNLLDLPERRFRGEVLAGRTVELAFQVGGPLIKTDLTMGRRVEAGEVLARIDPVRFEQQIATLRPKLKQAQTKLDRIQRMFDSDAASEAELLDARAAFDEAKAQLAVAEQAVQDTVLKAPFDALIVARLAENFQNVQAGTPVVRLQDITKLDIAVDLPETVVALHRGGERVEPKATYPVRPEQAYNVTFKEASAQADPQTGTYRVIYQMLSPKDFTALPGMAATIVFPPRDVEGQAQIAVPVAAITVDPHGGHRVWQLNSIDDQLYEVSPVSVEIDTVSAEWAILESGVEPGTLVATAGVAFLQEGQRVTRMEVGP